MASKIPLYLALIGTALAIAACQNCHSEDVRFGGPVSVGQAWVTTPPNANIFCNRNSGEACLSQAFFTVYYRAGGREYLAVVESGRVSTIKRYGTVCIDL